MLTCAEEVLLYMLVDDSVVNRLPSMPSAHWKKSHCSPSNDGWGKNRIYLLEKACIHDK